MDKKLQKLLDSNKIKYKAIPHRKVYTAFTEAETQHVDPRTVVKTVYIKLSKPTLHTVQSSPSFKKHAPDSVPGRGQGGDIKTGQIDSVLVAVPAKSRVDFKKIAKAVNDHAQKSYKLVGSHPSPQISSDEIWGPRNGVTANIGRAKARPYTKPTAVTVKMATEKDITKKLKTKVGLLHPLGVLFNIPLLLDKKLAKNKKVIVPAGSYTESLEISYKDILKITPGMEGNFTE